MAPARHTISTFRYDSAPVKKYFDGDGRERYCLIPSPTRMRRSWRGGLDACANVRPIRRWPGMAASTRFQPGEGDDVIVREDTERLHASRGRGVTSRWAASDVLFMPRLGVERVCRYAFELATRRNGAPAASTCWRWRTSSATSSATWAAPTVPTCSARSSPPVPAIQRSVDWSAADETFVAEMPELAGCMADGATPQEALANIQVIATEWIETAAEPGREIPRRVGGCSSPDPHPCYHAARRVSARGGG